MTKTIVYKVGQLVKNKRTRVVKRITKVAKGRVFWITKDGKRKGNCDKTKMTYWISGQK